MKAKIILEDGKVFRGFSFGARGLRFGEIVFNTSMTGYQEIITDPSYKGQIVTMTYPLIGNYGITPQDIESRKPFLEGFVVKECSAIASNWRAKQRLDTYLKQKNIVGISGVDTRALTRHIRLQGAMKAVLSPEEIADGQLLRRLKDFEGLIGKDLVKTVTSDKVFVWNKKGKFKVKDGSKYKINSDGILYNKEPGKIVSNLFFYKKKNSLQLSCHLKNISYDT